MEIKCHAQSHTPSSWSVGRYIPVQSSADFPGDRAYQRERWALKSNSNSNVVLGKIGQLANKVRYGRQLVTNEPKTIKKSSENWNQMWTEIECRTRSSSSTAQYSPVVNSVGYRQERAFQRVVREVQRAFSIKIITMCTPWPPSTAMPSPDPSHTVSTCPRASAASTWSPWEICKRGENRHRQKPSQPLTISSSLQPATCVSTHLSTLKLEAGEIRKSLHSPHVLRWAGGTLPERPCQKCTLTMPYSYGHLPSRHGRMRAFLHSKRQLCDAQSHSRHQLGGKWSLKASRSDPNYPSNNKRSEENDEKSRLDLKSFNVPLQQVADERSISVFSSL